ncbi:hypothetical protein CAPTEDRAFT_170026 [Capitella teleta]|uniref:Protein FAM221A n=1 Tax=Capitella teleta TaxID=283909 RepID=R7TIT6_CAPTE|nr:hypothetical protein CAPTEDRAFT_170026 [Capitella teleta]|eukprot:ELT93639.1 hypothetical protein CAPTEDRAFT_170026 [Capitella teleta]
MAGAQYNLKFDGEKAAAVDSYLEYKRIVGDDDGGKLFTPEEYEEYKRKKIPQRMKNRLFTAWSNSSGMDCKMIGPETPCFCGHRYKQHKTDFEIIPDDRPIMLPCKSRGCGCVSYHYVPLMGGQSIRCTCKHLANEHSATRPYQCQKSICQRCAGFKSSYSCGCGDTYMDHAMIVETKEEREARGHPVGQDVGYAAMGGLTGFSSLAEGYMRLDPSGRGVPDEGFLGQEITASDNPFLRSNVASIQSYRKATKDYDRLDEDMSERMSALRRPGESDMDYFERRYQEKAKSERAAKRAIPSKPRGASTSSRGARGSSSRK